MNHLRCNYQIGITFPGYYFYKKQRFKFIYPEKCLVNLLISLRVTT